MKIVACVSSNSGLGLQGELLFNIKEDMNRFRELTGNSGDLVLMGRKTFESIISISGAPLKNRFSIVLSSDESYNYSHSNVQVFNDVNKLIKHYQTMGENDKKVFVIGGGEVYSLMMPYAEEIFLTIVNKHVEADAYYPMELQDSLGFVPVEESEEYWSDKYDCYYKFVRYIKPVGSSI